MLTYMFTIKLTSIIKHLFNIKLNFTAQSAIKITQERPPITPAQVPQQTFPQTNPTPAMLRRQQMQRASQMGSMMAGSTAMDYDPVDMLPMMMMMNMKQQQNSNPMQNFMRMAMMSKLMGWDFGFFN